MPHGIFADVRSCFALQSMAPDGIRLILAPSATGSKSAMNPYLSRQHPV
jgi:hypothetical protein